MNFEEMTKEQLIKYINDLNENKNGKYGLIWDKEKEPEEIVRNCNKNIPILHELKEKNINNGGKENILIEGDNFHVLTVLNYTHKEMIDIIYIDPPYNTGNNDFTYNDKFVDSEDGYKHSKWLNFMEKRLRLSKNLLKSDGVIFISIDDNEYAQLKILCDSIFGEINFLGSIIQNKGNAQNDAVDIQKNHEYILTYRKEKRIKEGSGKVIPSLINKKKNTKLILNDEYGYFYKNGGITTGGEGGTLNHRPNLGYSIYYNPSSGDTVAIDDYNKEKARTSNIESEVYRDNNDLLNKGYYVVRPPKKDNLLGAWTWSIDKFNNEKHRILLSKNKDKYLVIKKEYVSEKMVSNIDGQLVYTEYTESNSKSIIDYSTGYGSTVLKNILNSNKMFNNPKNPNMIKYLISLYPNPDAKVLDFFAGSGTTGQAVLELNQEDNGSRQFILITNNENNICTDVTYPRLKTVITGVKKDKTKYSEGISASLKMLKTDFIENVGTRDQLYFDLTEKCIPMLCLKEETFEKQKSTNEFVIFTNLDKNKYTCIYFKIFGDKYDEFINTIKEIEETKSIYIFSLGDFIEESIFNDIKNYTIETIPSRILEIYKKSMKTAKE